MYDVIIIGAGPAGLTAGLYAGRYRLNTLIFEKVTPGGRILWTEILENFPGFTDGIPPKELMSSLEGQVKKLCVPIELKEVTQLSCKEKKVTVEGKVYQAETIIIASGSHPSKLGVPGEEEFIGRGVSFCATCDAPFFKNKNVTVVGGGNAAVEEALYLTKFANIVNVIHRRNELRASKVLQEKLKENKKINLVLESSLTKINGSNKVESVSIVNKTSGRQEDIACDGVFMFVGNKPNTGFIKDKLETDNQGFLVTNDEMQTSEEGVFACGDCCKKPLYQVVTACAEGAVAAASAHNYLLKK